MDTGLKNAATSSIPPGFKSQHQLSGENAQNIPADTCTLLQLFVLLEEGSSRKPPWRQQTLAKPDWMDILKLKNVLILSGDWRL
ncbi:hypothetical protein NDU88_003530 [Pleurodeles waltl]|uniref:Uncharacterized protein n=1 Tax=Pleurodeles waltl TaxID=8319 RepID=A0AAV7QCY2_PLEWA|nr:hypothetical protein NDU88_003530 [Pleurodeles waltl]